MEGTTVQRPHVTAALACSAAALLLATLTACDSAPEADTQKPTTPDHVTAQASSATSAHIMWEQAADNEAVTGYEVYRQGEKVKTVPATKVMTDIGGLTASTAYTFTVRARDAAGNLSAPSAAAAVTTPAPTPADHEPPTRPVKLRGAADGSRAVNLSWGGSTDDVGVTSYDIYQEDSRIHSVPGTRTTAHVTGLRPGTVYTFTVRARDAADTSSPDSNALDLTTASAPGAPASTAPTDLRISNRVQGKEYAVDLDWKQPDTGGEIPAYQLFMDGRLTTTIVWGATPPAGRASYRLTVSDPRGTRYSMKIRAKLPDGKWGDFSAQRTVVLGDRLGE
ncbi:MULTISPECIES: fibronectin type III domain-containing protein [unclassified Streptomyces]|uniref:fibronectin type III domain-containing protein n=1 Tax=unclassified Streptomyces TaxID=2593676 RepID=UPI00225460F2|nr:MULTISPECIES: fibronectin type III domain-containing protein [unclassified Streptomyces]MCX4790248.1 fibronectin type III domain-containing protein [Streptomyces sp. NBC_01221]MCX4794023.1 fibronectin type III domain-containing protein [Streptomyces sp. NBC_01242]WSJ35433.1 fibronectin type III domain-containing protein [Streptomyces sp. NBC_01321]WSP61865.1 fibronectin type III domain-containing protein [Streptomyces sp. NBC_01240]